MEKKRLVVLTDIYRMPDDKQSEIDDVESMIRLLLYANDIDIEGLIAVSSFCYRKGGTEKERRVILDIIDVVDKADPRPVWFGLWGGANTLAQAVWKVWKQRTAEDFHKFLSKIRVYGISDQDKGGIWMRENFGNRLFYIVSPTAGTTMGAVGFAGATWQGISFDYFMNKKGRKGFRGAPSEMITKEWIKHNICGDTRYRKMYPVPTMSMEGDTPSYLGLIPNGLNDMEHPDWGSWGGRYEYYLPDKAPVFGKKEKYPIWTNAEDTIALENGLSVKSNFATIWRWREAFQNDFLARLRWTETDDYQTANHAPKIKVNLPMENDVRVGEKVRLSAVGTMDPDGNKLWYHWFPYMEAGTYHQVVKIENANSQEAYFEAPEQAGTLHVILEVKDNGIPTMTSYRRIIFHVHG